MPNWTGSTCRRSFPDLPVFFAGIDARFAAIQQVLAGRPPGGLPQTIGLEVDRAAFQRLTYFDRAAVAVAKKEMEQLEQLTAELLDCTLELDGRAAPGNDETKPTSPSRLPVPDWDHLRSAAFVTTTAGVGFLIWIFFNPPGHALWFQLSGTIALMVALAPNIRASKLIMPVAVTSAACLAIYVFVMPQLSSYLGVGSLLFFAMFLTGYLLSGMARFFCNMAILNMLPIQNHQVYSFAAMANFYIFILMAFAFLFAMSYLLSSPRPEKAVLHLLDRFFRSAEFLMSRQATGSAHTSILDRWRIAFHERQLRSLPGKLATWGKSIDPTAVASQLSRRDPALGERCSEPCPSPRSASWRPERPPRQSLSHANFAMTSRPGMPASRPRSGNGPGIPRRSRSRRFGHGWRTP